MGRQGGRGGSHRYNGVRRERISGGSLTFPFVGSRDALGNRVIRFRPFAARAVRSPPSCSRVREDYRRCRTRGPSGDFARQNQSSRFVLCHLLHLAFVNVAKRRQSASLAPPASRPLSQLRRPADDRRAPAHLHLRGGTDGRLSRDNFVQTQIIHCHCGRKRLSGGIRNYMLNQEGAFWQIICKCAASPASIHEKFITGGFHRIHV